ncbi:MAG: hypothetical protein IKT46_09915 [Clostridia bacterium]|nr:hypothetical protein [Clostridia bacterium]
MEFFIIIPVSTIMPVLLFFLLCLVLGISDAQSNINTRAAHDFADKNTLTVLVLIGIFCLIIATVMIFYNYNKLRRKQAANIVPMILYSVISSAALFLGLENSYNASLYMVDTIAEFFGFDPFLIVVLFLVYLFIAILYLILIILVALPPIAVNLLVLYKTETQKNQSTWYIIGIVLATIIGIIYIVVHPNIEFNGCVTNLLK